MKTSKELRGTIQAANLCGRATVVEFPLQAAQRRSLGLPEAVPTIKMLNHPEHTNSGMPPQWDLAYQRESRAPNDPLQSRALTAFACFGRPPRPQMAQVSQVLATFSCDIYLKCSAEGFKPII